jgi:polysaccharide pyruvyl transferase WcaK-like protein
LPVPPTPRVLLVGAYERDNFGDLLFLLVTEQYLRDAEVVAAAPFAADMTELLGRQVPAYAPLLRRERFDVIWTVGGEVGAIGTETAYRLSATDDQHAAYQAAATPAERRRLLRSATGGMRLLAPYLPDPVAYPLNAGAVSVLNSAGLSRITQIGERRRARLETYLRGVTHVSVRDQESSDYLSRLGVAHEVAPDMVHAISVLRPVRFEQREDVAILQASKAVVRQLGHAEIGAALARSENLRGLRIRLLVAGTARGHDSVADYERIVRAARRVEPGLDIAVLDERRPHELADTIARATVVVSSSLHVRIIACAYGVPRLSLPKPKPTRYARRWDPDMPYDVTPDQLDEAVGTAMLQAQRPEVAARSADVVRQAHESMLRLVDRVLAQAASDASADVTARARLRRRNRRRARAGAGGGGAPRSLQAAVRRRAAAVLGAALARRPRPGQRRRRSG